MFDSTENNRHVEVFYFKYNINITRLVFCVLREINRLRVKCDRRPESFIHLTQLWSKCFKAAASVEKTEGE